MQTVNLYDAKNKFSKLIDAASEGETIVIARNGKPAAKLVPLSYGERTEWSRTLQQHMQSGVPYEAGFDIDRSDLLILPDRDLF